MNEMDEQIQRIEDKVLLLTKEYNLARKEIQRLQKENSRLNELVQLHNSQAEKFNQKAPVKVSTNALTPAEKKEIEKKIDDYLKDIDKCLALLHS